MDRNRRQKNSHVLNYVEMKRKYKIQQASHLIGGFAEQSLLVSFLQITCAAIGIPPLIV